MKWGHSLNVQKGCTWLEVGGTIISVPTFLQLYRVSDKSYLYIKLFALYPWGEDQYSIIIVIYIFSGASSNEVSSNYKNWTLSSSFPYAVTRQLYDCVQGITSLIVTFLPRILYFIHYSVFASFRLVLQNMK